MTHRKELPVFIAIIILLFLFAGCASYEVPIAANEQQADAYYEPYYPDEIVLDEDAANPDEGTSDEYTTDISSDYGMPGWRETFAAFLRNNYPERESDCGGFFGPHRFFLHDLDMDGVPEMFVLDTFENEAMVYAFRDDGVLPLYFGDMSLNYLLRGAARTSIGPAPGNTEGFVFSYRWPSAGMFGTGANFWRVVIDGDRLVEADFGQWYIDLAALHELFDCFGFNADEDELNAAILEHTRLHINDVTVTEEELDRVFGRYMWAGFRLYCATDENIDEIIFGWPG